MVANDLPFPPYDPELPPSDDLTTIKVTGDNYKTQGLQAQFAPSYSPSASQQSHTPSLQNITQFGINFVLALEQPCLSHRNHTPPDLLITDSMGATGHEAMLSSPITTRGPESTPISSFDEEYPPDAQWTVPTVELEGLLRLSQGLELGMEEVTPVQAWQIITQHNRFDDLTFELLERLRLVLLPMVECYGYVLVWYLSAYVANNLRLDLVPSSNVLDLRKLWMRCSLNFSDSRSELEDVTYDS